MDSTAPAAGGPLLVYDGECGFCGATSRWLVRKGVVDETQRRPFQAFEGEEATRLRAAGIHNEVAVLDQGAGEIRTGFSGLLWLARGTPVGRTARLVNWPPLRNLLALLYRVVSYNRRIVAPISPDRAARCDCDPDAHPGYRVAFIVLALAFAALGWLAFTWATSLGQSLFGERTFEHGVRVGLVAFALGCGPSLFLAATAWKRDGGALAAHVAYLAAAGGAVLLPAASPLVLASHLSAPGWVRIVLIVLTITVLLAFLGFVAHRRRRVLGYPPYLPWVGLALLVAGTAIAVAPVVKG